MNGERKEEGFKKSGKKTTQIHWTCDERGRIGKCDYYWNKGRKKTMGERPGAKYVDGLVKLMGNGITHEKLIRGTREKEQWKLMVTDFLHYMAQL